MTNYGSCMRRLGQCLLVPGLMSIWATPGAGQSKIVGTVHDSLSAGGPLAGAVLVLVERSAYATSDARGRFRFENLPAGRYSIGFMHAVLDSFDLVAPLRTVAVLPGDSAVIELSTPSAASAYALGCETRLLEVPESGEVLAYLKVRASCAALARRALPLMRSAAGPGDSSTQSNRPPTRLLPVVIRDTVRSLSPMLLSGFEDRRRMGLGTFVTQEFLSTQKFETLASLMGSVLGVHIEYGTSGQPGIYVRGNKEGFCVPTFFVDGMSFAFPRPNPALRPGNASGTAASGGGQRGIRDLDLAYRDLSSSVRPWEIKGIEVYSSPGVMPAQFDLTSSTGCGSIVIWTR